MAAAGKDVRAGGRGRGPGSLEGAATREGIGPARAVRPPNDAPPGDRRRVVQFGPAQRPGRDRARPANVSLPPEPDSEPNAVSSPMPARTSLPPVAFSVPIWLPPPGM